MKVNFTIAVRNPEWYWSKDELEKAGDYRKEWETLNEDKIWKHVPLEEFEVPFDVKDIKEMRQGEFEVRLTSQDQVQSISHKLKDVTIVQFIGESAGENTEVVISNSLIHQYIGARQKQYKYYIYFYLKENTYYQKLHQLIWISEAHKRELEKSFGGEFQEQ